MNPIFNTKNRFYDYFPHLPAMRMKIDFGLGFYEQSAIRNYIQKDIRLAYDRMVASHNLMHVYVYGEIGEEFDENFYKELKDNLHQHFNESYTWAFLDPMLKKTHVDEEEESANFNTRLQATIGYGLNRNSQGKVNLKEAFVALLKTDLNVLSGRELLYLTKIK